MLYLGDDWKSGLEGREDCLNSDDKIEEQEALWKQTKSYELFNNKDGVLETPFGIMLFEGPAKVGMVVDVNAIATTSEEIDRRVLQDLRVLSDLNRTSTAIAFVDDYYLKSKNYGGPFLPELIECAKEFDEGLKSIIATMEELNNKDNLTLDSLSAAINEKELPCKVSMTVYDENTDNLSKSIFKENTYNFRHSIPPLMSSIKKQDWYNIIGTYLNYNYYNLEDPREILYNLNDDYYHGNNTDIIVGLLEDVLEGYSNSYNGRSYLRILEDSKVLCEKAADMANELEHALELNRDKAREQNVTDPDKSIPAWTPDAAKKAQTKGKSSKSKDEMVR